MPDLAPAWLGPDEAAAYLGLRLPAFLRRVKAYNLPAPSYHLGQRTPRWNVAALDSAMGAPAASPHRAIVTKAMEDMLAEGRARRAAKSRGRQRSGVSVSAPSA